MKTDATDNAFSSLTYGDGMWEGEPGLTKREYFAAMALQAVNVQAHVASPAAKHIAESAVNIADALIEALNKETT